MMQGPAERRGRGKGGDPGAFDGEVEGYPGGDDPRERLTAANVVNMVRSGLAAVQNVGSKHRGFTAVPSFSKNACLKDI